MVIDDKEVHPENALPPMIVTVLGILTDVRALH